MQLAENEYLKKCCICKEEFKTTYPFAKKCKGCKAPIAPQGSPCLPITMRPTIKKILAELAFTPYAKGYLQALVDCGHLESTTLDELVKWASYTK